jgi:hypothetical protein
MGYVLVQIIHIKMNSAQMVVSIAKVVVFCTQGKQSLKINKIKKVTRR